MDNKKPLVVISCMTFNHESYIRDALEGFVMQKTTFPFVVIVHDDASTDGTATIIREYAEKYPDIINPIYETENQYSKKDGSLTCIMNAACEATGAKYIAVCEGDDYWTDPFKLQKQVDFLKANPEYGLVYSRVKIYSQEKKTFLNDWGGPSESFEELIQANTIPTLSAVYQRKLYEKYCLEIQPITHNWLMGDYPMWLWIAKNSKIKFIDDITGIYRQLTQSASHSQKIIDRVLFAQSFEEIKLFYLKKYEQKDYIQTITEARILQCELLVALLTKNKARIDDCAKQMRNLSKELRLGYRLKYWIQGYLPKTAFYFYYIRSFLQKSLKCHM